MFRNFLTIAWRSLLRNKLHSFINVTGLAIGVAACMVIYLIVDFELSFNKQHQGYERIYRIHSSFQGVFSGLNRGAPTAVGPTIKDEFKGVEAVTSFQIFNGKVEIPNGNEKTNLDQQQKIILAEPAFFSVFKSYEWIAGSPESLTEPFKVVLTESRAKTYFGTTDPMKVVGRQVIYRDSLETTVAGIVKDLPFNTDIDMTDFISYSTIEKSWLKRNVRLNDWQSVNSSSQVFVLVDQATDLKTFTDQFAILKKRYKEKSTWDVENNFSAQPFSDLHYNNETGIFDYSRSPAHLPTLTVLIIVAGLLLVIGAINFVNLETAQAVRRAKEVGVRKTLGSSRAALVTQFLYQSFIITVVAVLLALPLTELALKTFSDFVPAGVTLSLRQVAPFLIAVIAAIGLLAGLYPAFIMSSFLPALALKNQAHATSGTSRSAFMRKTLIVFQFAIAQVLIIGALAVGWQISYMLNKDIGFKKDAVVYLYTPWQEKSSKIEVFKNELSQISQIEALSLSDSPPSENGWSSNTVEYKPEKGEIVKVNAFRKFGDPSYIGFYDIKLVSGRNLRPTDSLREFLINKTLMTQLGFSTPEEAIDKTIKYSDREYPIVGVVEDFHIQSLHKKVEPVIMGNDVEFSCFNIRLSTASGSDEFKAGIAKIEEAWKKVYPNQKFSYEFLDETLKNFYQSEQRVARLVKTAMTMAIFISCLGLFGLASFTTTQRMKEISIRKVLGSSVSGIVVMLSKDFIYLILIAFVIASPLAWYFVNQWLAGFAYHMDVSVWLFVFTVVAGVLIAFVTVGYQTVKAANSNPVNSLRNE
ncbi:MAG TPA: ABC transporter permease [Cyclobacteriaceae bacterium]|nr:ABC transporter permease [Cyclobacteriaceae bacterium]HMV08817.1 ABC transporter permease [Cyclobacteriaceae bacterium]HMW99963.1 ABC transporter permease [Cyclobacteriaceae bacterium]HMX49174.1 ABC transporter permease [Cyclobacteriaceae bacterium]HMY92784.1 ABC transporter permease [Cyclobacteriaceae bacterium]